MKELFLEILHEEELQEMSLLHVIGGVSSNGDCSGTQLCNINCSCYCETNCNGNCNGDCKINFSCPSLTLQCPGNTTTCITNLTE